MAEDKVAVLRGKQVSLVPASTAKGISFLFEKELPATDEEIIDREETIAQIELAILPFRSVVKLGEQIQKAIREDITLTMEARLHDDAEPGLFDDAKIKMKVGDREVETTGKDFKKALQKPRRPKK